MVNCAYENNDRRTRALLRRRAGRAGPWPPSDLDGTGNGNFSYDERDPVTGNYYLLTSDKVILFHREGSHFGFHLGALDRTTKQWVWKTALTGPLNGKGQFDPIASYAGWSFNVCGDDDIFLLYRGEFWDRDKQANQIFHYKGNGAFAGQFGTPFTQKSTYPNAPGMAQNMASVSPYKVGTKMYVYPAEEGGRGVHRWQFDVP
jgi:hypothetical protein